MDTKEFKKELEALKEDHLADYYEKVEALTERYKKLGLIKEPEHLPGRWKPDTSQGYFYNNQKGGVVYTEDFTVNISKATIQHDRAYENCGETEEEIKSVHDRKLKYQEIIDRIREFHQTVGSVDWDDNKQIKYGFQITNLPDRVKSLGFIDVLNEQTQPGCQYFRSEQVRNKIIIEFGVKTIALCFFGVELED